MKIEEILTMGRRLAGEWSERAERFLKAGDRVSGEALSRKAGLVGQCLTILEGSGSARAEAAYNIGVYLAAEGREEEAVGCFRFALGLKPGSVEALNNLGVSLRKLMRFGEAEAVLEQLMALDGANVAGRFNLGLVLMEEHRYGRAKAHFERAIAIRPGYAAATWGVGYAWRKMGRIDLALEAFKKSIELDPGRAATWSDYLLGLNYSPAHSGADVVAEHKRFDERFIGPVVARGAMGGIRDADPERRLRIGYVSGDFSEHVAGRVAGHFISRHDKSRFEVLLYSNGLKEDGATREFEKAARVMRRVAGWSDERLARQVAADGVDILVDLNQHTPDNRLTMFAYRPAPVQVTHVGYPGTTGVSTIDWRISDPFHDPVEGGGMETVEGVWRLPHTFACYAPWPHAPDVSELPARKEGRVTFGSLNNVTKINFEVIGVWARIMRRVGGSRLMLVSEEEHGPIMDFLQRFGELGIDGRRVTFLHRSPTEEYLGHYGMVDVGLDPWPFNGLVTTCDAVYQGVPVVTLAGKTAVGRGGVSLNVNLGLGELVAGTVEEYEEIAVGLAGDLDRLAKMRRGMRVRLLDSPICKLDGYTRDLEEAYRGMWRKRLGG